MVKLCMYLLISELNVVLLHVPIDLLPLLSQVLVQVLNQLAHLVPVAHQGGQHLLHCPLHQDSSNHPEALPVSVHTPQGLYHYVVLVQVLLQLVGLASNLSLLLPHLVEPSNNLLL